MKRGKGKEEARRGRVEERKETGEEEKGGEEREGRKTGGYLKRKVRLSPAIISPFLAAKVLFLSHGTLCKFSSNTLSCPFPCHDSTRNGSSIPQHPNLGMDSCCH